MPYDHKSDIWSLGCVLYEMVMLCPPFRAATMKALYTRVISGKFDPISNNYSSDLRNIVKACLQVRSSERTDCEKILAMPGLLNHITGTLDDIQALKQDQESLLQTIRCPRNLGMITERLPAAQYDTSEKKKSRTSATVASSRSENIEEIVTELREKARLTSAAQPVRPNLEAET